MSINHVKRAKILTRMLIGLFLLGITGCGSIVSHRLSGPRIYGGIRCDCQVASEIPLDGGLFLLLDLPFSFLFDTLLLPVALVHYGEFGERPLITPYTPHVPKVEGRLQGVVIQDSPSGYRVWSGLEFLATPPATRPVLVGARIWVISNPMAPPLSDGLANHTDGSGSFTVSGVENGTYFIRVEGDGFQTVEVPVSSLHNPTDRSYWDEHLLVIRMTPR